MQLEEKKLFAKNPRLFFCGVAAACSFQLQSSKGNFAVCLLFGLDWTEKSPFL